MSDDKIAEKIVLCKQYVTTSLDMIPYLRNENEIIKLFSEIREKLDIMEDSIIELNK